MIGGRQLGRIPADMGDGAKRSAIGRTPSDGAQQRAAIGEHGGHPGE